MATTKRKKPSLVSLTYFGFQVNAAIEDGHGQRVTFAQIYKGIEWGTLMGDLDKKLPKVFDFGLFQQRPEESEALVEALQYAASGMKGSERKYGIKKNGLSLLMAFILEAIQHTEFLDNSIKDNRFSHRSRQNKTWSLVNNEGISYDAA